MWNTINYKSMSDLTEGYLWEIQDEKEVFVCLDTAIAVQDVQVPVLQPMQWTPAVSDTMIVIKDMGHANIVMICF